MSLSLTRARALSLSLTHTKTCRNFSLTSSVYMHTQSSLISFSVFTRMFASAHTHARTHTPTQKKSITHSINPYFDKISCLSPHIAHTFFLCSSLWACVRVCVCACVCNTYIYYVYSVDKISCLSPHVALPFSLCFSLLLCLFLFFSFPFSFSPFA